MSDRIRDEWRRQQAKQERLKAERLEKPWAIFLNGKLHARATSHAEAKGISAALAKAHSSAYITQRYEGKVIDHQPNRSRSDG